MAAATLLPATNTTALDFKAAFEYGSESVEFAFEVVPQSKASIPPLSPSIATVPFLFKVAVVFS